MLVRPAALHLLRAHRCLRATTAQESAEEVAPKDEAEDRQDDEAAYAEATSANPATAAPKAESATTTTAARIIAAIFHVVAQSPGRPFHMRVAPSLQDDCRFYDAPHSNSEPGTHPERKLIAS